MNWICNAGRAQPEAHVIRRDRTVDHPLDPQRKSAQNLIFTELRRSLDRQYENSQALDRKAAFSITASSVVVGFVGLAEGPSIDPDSVTSVRAAFELVVVSLWMMGFIGIYLGIVLSTYAAYRLQEREAGTLHPRGLLQAWKRTERGNYDGIGRGMADFLERAHCRNSPIMKAKASHIGRSQKLLVIQVGWLGSGLLVKWLYDLFHGLGTYMTGSLYEVSMMYRLF